jgi:hypothetical protein
MNPSGMSSEDSKSITRPETVGWAPVSNIGTELLGVFIKTFKVALPLESSLFS